MKENASALTSWGKEAKKGTRLRYVGIILDLIFTSSELPQVWVTIQQFNYRMKRGKVRQRTNNSIIERQRNKPFHGAVN